MTNLEANGQRNNSIELESPSLDTISIFSRRLFMSTRDSSLGQNRSTMMAPKCKAPVNKKFAHPCGCGRQSTNSGSHQQYASTIQANMTDADLPMIASKPMYLFDPVTSKCYPTSRDRDMLLKQCDPQPQPQIGAFPTRSPHLQTPTTGSCYYSDLVCDPRRFRCVCKQPSLHLYYNNDFNYTSFGCVPMPTNQSGNFQCKPGQIYNMASKECQKIFDVSELPPIHSMRPPGSQFSFITIVFVWVLLLILILSAKLRKLRGTNIYTDRRSHHHYHYHRSSSPNSRQLARSHGSWFHPFMTAINGHPYIPNSHHTMGEHGNYNDTDLFLGGRRLNEALNAGSTLGNSEQSLNTLPPPKFEEIYPSCPLTEPQPPPPLPTNLSNDDLPTFDEAMKLQNRTAPDVK